MKLSEDRQIEIYIEAKRRAQLIIAHEGHESVSQEYTTFRIFNMQIGLIGLPFVRKKWQIESDWKPFVTDEEFYSDDYDTIMMMLWTEFGNDIVISI